MNEHWEEQGFAIAEREANMRSIRLIAAVPSLRYAS